MTEAIKYFVTCLHCGEVSPSARQKMYCSDECRKAFHKIKTQEAVTAVKAECLSVEVLKEQEKQNSRKSRLDAARDNAAVRLPWEYVSTDEELAQVQAEWRENVMQGRSKVHAFHVGFGPGV